MAPNTTSQLIAAIETFLRETTGIVCMDSRHQQQFQAARDALLRAMIDAKFPEGSPRLGEILDQATQTAKRIIREERKNERTISDIDCVRLD